MVLTARFGLPGGEWHLCPLAVACRCADPGAQPQRLQFHDAADASLWLLRAAVDVDTMLRLRALHAEFAPMQPLEQLSDHAVIEELSELLRQGRLNLVQCQPPLRHHASTAREEPAPLAPPTAVRAGHRSPREEASEVLDWIAIQLLDEQQRPIPEERYRIKLPDGSLRQGRLDKEGLAQIENIPGGSCEVSFLDIDGREWKPA